MCFPRVQTYSLLGKVFQALPAPMLRKRMSFRTTSPPKRPSTASAGTPLYDKPKIDSITSGYGGGLFMLEVAPSLPLASVWVPPAYLPVLELPLQQSHSGTVNLTCRAVAQDSDDDERPVSSHRLRDAMRDDDMP